MVLLNFGHPLTREHLDKLQEIRGTEGIEVVQVKTMLDHRRPFAEQVRRLMDSIQLSPEEWQTVPLLVNLPSLNVIAALVLAEMHGRCGYFPPVIRLRPVEGSVPPRFEVAEILNLQAVRDAARATR